MASRDSKYSVLQSYSFSAFVLILVLSSANLTDAGEIQGIVCDPYKNPLSNVVLTFFDSQETALSGTNGQFQIRDVPAGSYVLQATHIGYEPYKMSDIRVKAGEITNLDTLFLTPMIYTSDGIVVNSRPLLSSISGQSYSSSHVSAVTIARRQAKTSAEALREEVGVFIQKTSHGGGSAIIRGLSSNQILLLVDGIRVNNSTYRLGNHQYLTTIDQLMAGRIEVQRGPASVAFGSDAMGGAVNVVSKDPLINAEKALQARFFSRLASADKERTIRGEIDLSTKKMGIRLGLNYKKVDDLRRGKWGSHRQLDKSTNGLYQSPSGFDAYDLDSKLMWARSSAQVITFAFQHSRKNNVPRYDKYENNQYFNWQYHPQIRSLIYGRYQQAIVAKFIQSLEFTLSYQVQKEGRIIQQSEQSDQFRENDRVRTLGSTIVADTKIGIHQIKYGTDVYYDWISSKRFIFDMGSGELYDDRRGRFPDNSDYGSYGLFIQDDLNLAEKWKLFLGARYSYHHTVFRLSGDFSNETYSLNFQALTGQLSLRYKADERFYLETKVSQAFRAPNLSDLAKLGESKGDIVEIPNPGLEAEKLTNFELGLGWQNNSYQLSVSFYYAKIRDLISSASDLYNGSPVILIENRTYQVKSKQNTGNAYIYGLEADFKAGIYSHLGFYSSLTATYGHNQTRNEPVGGIPPLFGRSGFSLDMDPFDLETFIRFAFRQDRLSADDKDDPRIPAGGTPGWWTLALRISYRLFNSTTLYFGVENIADINYREHGSGINGAGRNYIVALNIDL